MKVGDIVVLIEDHIFLGTDYKKGQKFRIISDSGFRGWDLESLDTVRKYMKLLLAQMFMFQ